MRAGPPPIETQPNPPGRTRGRAMARALAGSWRPAPPPLDDPRALAPILSDIIYAGGGALVSRRLAATSALLDEPLADPLRQLHRRQVLAAAVAERDLARLVAVLRSAGIEP